MRPAEHSLASHTQRHSQVIAAGAAPAGEPLAGDALVMLDPAVELAEAEVHEFRFLCHNQLEAGLAVPPGDGLLAFVRGLMAEPVRVEALREEFDDAQLVDEILASLHRSGFLLVTGAERPSPGALEALREAALATRNRDLRRSIHVDLDAAGAAQRLPALLAAEARPPDLILHCRRLADHGEALAGLAELRQQGRLRLYRTVVRTGDAACDDATCRALLRLAALVHIEGVSWPAPAGALGGVAELTRHRVAVHALMAPDLSILDAEARGRAAAWARANFVSGLGLDVDPDRLWPDGAASDDDFLAVFRALRALEQHLGDVVPTNLPDDEALLGTAGSAPPAAPSSELARRFRRAYLHFRIPFLKSCEAQNTWSQTPEAEEKLVRAADDLLPNHPELLGLRPGSILVDVCGGLGRVARRLSPAVGADGAIVSIEMLRCVSDRARNFACEKNLTNLHFRPGFAQRIPLPDGAADAAVNEWTGAIWELGIGPAMIAEMARVVRPGGRIAVTHRLVRVPLRKLGEPWVQYDEIYGWISEAFAHPALTILKEHIWGQMAPSLVGEKANMWRRQYVQSIVDPFDFMYEYEESPGIHADMFLTIIAERQ